MNGTPDGKYSIQKTENILIFKTAYFTADKGSVLHSGIYNKEFTSVLAASVTAGLASLAFIMISGRTIFSYIVFILISIAGFPVFRRFVFKDRCMETIFDNSAGRAEIYLQGIIKKKKDIIPIKDIVNVIIERKKTEVENPDGTEFVKKISLQHGTVIPGFGEEIELFMLKLVLTGGNDRLLYADSNMQDVMKAHDEIKGFLKISL